VALFLWAHLEPLGRKTGARARRTGNRILREAGERRVRHGGRCGSCPDGTVSCFLSLAAAGRACEASATRDACCSGRWRAPPGPPLSPRDLALHVATASVRRTYRTNGEVRALAVQDRAELPRLRDPSHRGPRDLFPEEDREVQAGADLRARLFRRRGRSRPHGWRRAGASSRAEGDRTRPRFCPRRRLWRLVHLRPRMDAHAIYGIRLDGSCGVPWDRVDLGRRPVHPRGARGRH